MFTILAWSLRTRLGKLAATKEAPGIKKKKEYGVIFWAMTVRRDTGARRCCHLDRTSLQVPRTAACSRFRLPASGRGSRPAEGWVSGVLPFLLPLSEGEQWDSRAGTPAHTPLPNTHTHTHPLLSSLPRKDKVFSFLSTVSISPLILTSPHHLFSIPTKGIQISPVPTEEIHTMKLQVSTLNSGSPTSNGLSPAQKPDCISLISSLFRTTEWLFQTSIPLRSLKVVRIHCPTGWNEKSILLSQRLGASDPTNPNS